jgi:hypothetical protein
MDQEKPAPTPTSEKTPDVFTPESLADFPSLNLIPPTGDGYTIGTDKAVTLPTSGTNNIWRTYRVKPPIGGPFFVAIIRTDRRVLSTRTGKWAYEPKIEIADLICPSKTLSDWDVKQVDPSKAPPLSLNRISLAMVLPKLPAEAQSWLNRMTPEERGCTEHILELVGPDSFVANWQTYRDDLQAARDF